MVFNGADYSSFRSSLFRQIDGSVILTAFRTPRAKNRMSDRCPLMHKPGNAIIPTPCNPWIWAIPLIAAIALLLIKLTDSNQTLFLLINGLNLGATSWSGLTILGDTVVALALLLPFCGRRPDMVRALVIAAIIATLSVHLFKDLFEVLRPAGVLALEQFNIIGPELKKGSFPSGHTTTIFLLVGIICLLNQRKAFCYLLVILAFAVGLSRSGVGAHWPADVMAGAINGWLSAVIGVYLAKKWQGGLSLTAQRIFAGILLLCALMLLFGWHDTRYPDAFWFEKLIALLCLALSITGLKGLIKK